MPRRVSLFGLSVFLAVCAVFPVLLGWFALRNLWSDYQDSHPATYLVVGGLSWLLALILIVAAYLTARRAIRSNCPTTQTRNGTDAT